MFQSFSDVLTGSCKDKLSDTFDRHDMFTICSFNSPDLDGYQGTRENKNVPRETHKGDT
jgi:hypothetical protein